MALISALYFQGDERVLDIGCGNEKINFEARLVASGQRDPPRTSFEHDDARYLDLDEDFDYGREFRLPSIG